MSARLLGLASLVILAGGCAVAVDPRPAREEVSRLLGERSDRGVPALVEALDDRAVAERIAAMTSDGLTVDGAVEITLIHNRELRALYTDLDVAQSDVVQASLLHNPVVDAAAGVPIAGGVVDVSFGAAVDVIDLLYVPLRKRVAGARLEQTKRVVAGRVLDYAWRAQTAYYGVLADQQALDLRRQVADSAAASLELVRRMRDAGNATDLDLASAQAFAEEARLDVRSAEMAVRQSVERLNAVMGLWGPAAARWKTASERLPDPPDDPLDEERLESRAVARSLDLAAAEHLVVAAGEAVGLDRAGSLFPELVVGGKGERRDAKWDAGPTLALPIPFFDHGQARVARARAELERARDLYYALGVQVRAATRMARDRLSAHRERALHYRRVLLPIEDRLVRETMLHYNAMQIGPADLLRAKERQIEAAARYVESLRDYWTARADLGLILAGRIPAGEPAPAPPRLEQLPRFPFPAIQ